MDKVKELKEKLMLKKQSAYIDTDENKVRDSFNFCEGYKKFLDKCKTEREVVAQAIEMAENLGFREFNINNSYKAGDKVYYNNRNKALILAVIGEENLHNGINIIASHADAPRLDLKQNPLYESDGISLFKTQYYGGIKKYQWTTIPMSLHGKICLKDGKELDICIGEEDDESKFIISEILIHLATDQLGKKANKAVEGEQLNAIAGTMPYKANEGNDLIKLNVLNLLNEKYGITEEDFCSADLTLVPAAKACDIGFDSSIVASYGQDDRICVYTSLMALLEYTGKGKTAIAVFADREEIGSCGNTGFDSDFIKNFIMDLSENQQATYTTVCKNSACISADVTAAFDPAWPEVFDKNNTAYLNHGVVITKYTGSRGKGGASEASAEFVSKVRNMLNDNNIPWQACELGKVDVGGGGTVAKFAAALNIDVLDMGVALLSMHAPIELSSKLDTYLLYEAYKYFFLY